MLNASGHISLYSLSPNSKEIQFGLFSSQDVVNLSELEVTHPLLYKKDDPTRQPELHGVLDNRLVSISVMLAETLTNAATRRGPSTSQNSVELAASRPPYVRVTLRTSNCYCLFSILGTSSIS